MSKHTPGPWKFNECDDCRDGGEIVAEPPYQTIRVCEIPLWLAAPEEMRANARMIAAAPELYEALKAADDAISAMSKTALETGMEGTSQWDAVAGGADIYGVQDKIRAALAKATE